MLAHRCWIELYPHKEHEADNGGRSKGGDEDCAYVVTAYALPHLRAVISPSGGSAASRSGRDFSSARYCSRVAASASRWAIELSRRLRVASKPIASPNASSAAPPAVMNNHRIDAALIKSSIRRKR